MSDKHRTSVFYEPKVVPASADEVMQPSPGQGDTPIAICTKNMADVVTGQRCPKCGHHALAHSIEDGEVGTPCFICQATVFKEELAQLIAEGKAVRS